MKKLICLIFVGMVVWGQQRISLIAPPPSPVTRISVNRIGNPGNTTYYYWVVANYPIGQSIASPFFIQRQSPDTLGVTNYNVVNYGLVSGAVSYDILRTTSANLQSPCNCAIATGQTSGSYNDQSNSTSVYTLAPVGNFTATISVDNQNYAQARVNIDTPLNIPYLGSYTVATLPSTPKGYALAVVTDGANSTTPCNSGGGTTFSACVWNGASWQAMGSGGGSGTPPTIVSFNTALGTCSIVGGTAVSCTSSNTSGTGGRPGVVVTDNFGQIIKWGSCYTGGTTNAILGGLTATTAIQDVVITSSNNITTFTFSGATTGYCGISTGGMGPTGATGQGVPPGGTTNQTLIKSSNADYVTTWANAPTGPAQTGVNKLMDLQADGLGGTKWTIPDWPGLGLGTGRHQYFWSATGNGYYPSNASLTCEFTAGGSCAVTTDSTQRYRYVQAATLLTTAAGYGAFENPYPYYTSWGVKSNLAIGAKFRYYNATAPTGQILVWGVGVENSAGNAKSSTGDATGANGAIIGIRYHANVDYTDAHWMCVYAASTHAAPSLYTEVDSGVAFDTNWHTFEVAILDVGPGSPDIQYFIDGNRVCQAGISGATFTVSTFLTNIGNGTYAPPYYLFSSVYNYAALTGNIAQWIWTASSQDVY